jgi:hypothetical protein
VNSCSYCVGRNQIVVVSYSKNAREPLLRASVSKLELGLHEKCRAVDITRRGMAFQCSTCSTFYRYLTIGKTSRYEGESGRFDAFSISLIVFR